MSQNNFQVGKIYSMPWDLNDSEVHYFLVLKQNSQYYFNILRDDKFLTDCCLDNRCFQKAKLVL